MTDHLDAPAEEWPHDPRQLLGVSVSADKREVRRAYSQLIKRFRPEDSPAEFQRVREAYESVLADLEGPAIRLSASSANPFGNSYANQATENSGSYSVQHRSRRAGGTESNDTANDTVDPQWLRFKDDPQQVYSELLQQSQASPMPADFLRLYWSLLLEPTLDSCEPADWLTIGLSALSLDSSELLEVYSQQLTVVPQECRTERCQQLLDCDGAIDAYCEFVFHRWRSLAKLRQWQSITEDIEPVKERIVLDSPVQWGKLLLSLTNALFQATDAEGKILRARVEAELGRIQEVQLQLEDELQHRDMMNELRKSLRGHAHLSAPMKSLLDVVRDSVCFDFLDMKKQLWQLASQWRQSPHHALDLLDDLVEFSPTAAFILLRQMEVIRYSQISEPIDEDGLAASVAQFVKRHSRRTYQGLRRPLLKFCLDEYISPGDFAAALVQVVGRNKRQVHEFVSYIESDLSLMCVCMACQATVVTA